MKELEQKARELRQKFIKTACLVDATHVASCLSCIDIITALYFGGILKYDSKDPAWAERDRFILSKGHAGLALYNALCEAGFFSREELNTYCKPGAIIGTHPTPAIPGVEGVTGALGHGLPFAVGMALALRLKKNNARIYVLTGDGECQEGSIWEAALSINQFKLNNLIWIIDYNSWQLVDEIDNVIQIEPLEKKLQAFGFDVFCINGHNINELVAALNIDEIKPKKPLALITKTIKGKGVSFLENKRESHVRMLTKDEYAMVLEQFCVSPKERNLP